MRSFNYFQDIKLEELLNKLNSIIRSCNGLDKKNLVIYINISDKQLLDKVFGKSTQDHSICGIPIKIKKEGEPALGRYEEEIKP